MQVEIKGKNLVITIPFNEKGELSKTEKSLTHATSKGNVQTSVMVNGKPLKVGVNAFTSKD